MRARKHKAPRRKRAVNRMRGDWVIGIHMPCGVAVPANVCDAGSVGIANPVFFSLIDSQDLLDKEDKLTVVRTVGEIYVGGSALWTPAGTSLSLMQKTWTLHEGIYVAGADGASPTASTIALDPSLAEDCELDTWMWLRHRSVSWAESINAPVQVPLNFEGGTEYLTQHIDLRVKRKVERGQELVYCAKITFHDDEVVGGDTVSSNWFIDAYLRLYCKF